MPQHTILTRLSIRHAVSVEQLQMLHLQQLQFAMRAAHHALLQVKAGRGWLHYRPELGAGCHVYEDSQGEPLDPDVIDNTWPMCRCV